VRCSSWIVAYAGKLTLSLHSNAYFRKIPLEYPLISLAGYLRFWAVAFMVVTLYLAYFQPEDPVPVDEPDMDIKKVYSIMWDICKLKRKFLVILYYSSPLMAAYIQTCKHSFSYILSPNLVPLRMTRQRV
jgi:hypothetical protein